MLLTYALSKKMFAGHYIGTKRDRFKRKAGLSLSRGAHSLPVRES